MRVRLITAAALVVISTACAKRPDAIAAVDIPATAYTHLDCIALSQESLKLQQALSELAKQQTKAADGDAIGVFLIGVPLSSAGGADKEALIATTKGKIAAVENAARQNSCKSNYFSDPTLRK